MVFERGLELIPARLILHPDLTKSVKKLLSEQLNKTRILTSQDIDTSAVSVGTKVSCESDGEIKEFSLLGPWDADPAKNILSFQSKLAQNMNGLAIGDSGRMSARSHSTSSWRSEPDQLDIISSASSDVKRSKPSTPASLDESQDSNNGTGANGRVVGDRNALT